MMALTDPYVTIPRKERRKNSSHSLGIFLGGTAIETVLRCTDGAVLLSLFTEKKNVF